MTARLTPLRLAWLDLARHRASTLLALVSLSLLVACGGLLVRTSELAGSRFKSVVHGGDAIVGAKADPIDMTLSALNLEGAYPETIPLRFATLLNHNWLDSGFSVRVTPILFCGHYKGHRVIATTREIFARPGSHAGVTLASGFWSENAPAVVIGAETARRERLHLGSAVWVEPWKPDSASGPAHPRLMQVTGILKPMGNSWDHALFTHVIQGEILAGRLDPAHWNGDWTPLILHYLLLDVPQGGMQEVQKVVSGRTVAQVASIPETLRLLERLTDSGRRIAWAAGLLGACLAAVAVAAIMLGRFEGLRRQLTTLEALGYSRRGLRAMLAWEGLLLGLGSVVLGGFLDAALFPWLRRALGGALPGADMVPSHFWQSAPVWAIVIPFMILVSVLSGQFVFGARASARLRGLA